MHLSTSELEQFFRIQSALNNFIYAQLQQAAGRKPKLPFRELPFDKQMEVRETFAKDPEYVERFVAENPGELSADDREIAEILLCCHGGAHNDTICMAEKLLPSEIL